MEQTSTKSSEESITTEELAKSSKCSASKPPSSSSLPRPKKKVCLIVSYLGTNYSGSAFLSDTARSASQHKDPSQFRAVENDIWAALVKSGVIDECNSADPKKCGFTRSSRTDKGVHAACATFGVKLRNPFLEQQHQSDDDDSFSEEDPWQRLVHRLNECVLNDQLRFQHIRRVTKKFNAYTYCSSRRYRYVCPTFLFDPDFDETQIPDFASKFRLKCGMNAVINQKNHHSDKIDSDDGDDPRRTYRINQDKLSEIQRICDECFRGTRNYHNLTRSVVPNDPSAQRFMRFVGLSDTKHLSTQLIQTTDHSSSSSDDRDSHEDDDDDDQHLTSETADSSGLKKKMKKKKDTKSRKRQSVADYPHLASVFVSEEDGISNGIEFIEFIIHGDSFMYHQIRKMMAIVVCLMRRMKLGYDQQVSIDDWMAIMKQSDKSFNDCDETERPKKPINPTFSVNTVDLPNDSIWLDDEDNDEQRTTKMIGMRSRIIEALFSDRFKLAVPLAPGEGLYLNRVDFERYNDKCRNLNQPGNQILYDSCQSGIDEFISMMIRPKIVGYELNECCFSIWLHNMKYWFIQECVEITDELKQLLRDHRRTAITVGVDTLTPIWLRGRPIKGDIGTGFRQPSRGSKNNHRRSGDKRAEDKNDDDDGYHTKRDENEQIRRMKRKKRKTSSVSSSSGSG